MEDVSCVVSIISLQRNAEVQERCHGKIVFLNTVTMGFPFPVCSSEDSLDTGYVMRMRILPLHHP